MHRQIHPLEKYVRKNALPHIWCPGCGNGIILNSFLRAIDETKYDLNKLVIVSGIGCAGRISSYVNVDAFHATHGRPVAIAAGVKIAKPNLKVFVISGDGDLFAIGGNHFIHAARKNMDMTVICSNNFLYSMTGGQAGPTTPRDIYTTTTPYGNFEHPFNLVYLATGAGAVYVARWTTMHPRELTESIKKTFFKDGFTFIEVISPCPTLFGKYSKIGSSVEMMRWLKENTSVERHADPSEAEIVFGRKIVCGEFQNIHKVTYTELLARTRNQIDEQLKMEKKQTLVKI
jgi:2-oxoglutarate ferredoxin oxidoreductase subunit beta